MLWALASSAFVIYLYRTLKAGSVDAPDNEPADTVEAELVALDARIAALEGKVGKQASGRPTP